MRGRSQTLREISQWQRYPIWRGECRPDWGLQTPSLKDKEYQEHRQEIITEYGTILLQQRRGDPQKMLQSDVNSQVEGIKEVESEPNHLTLEESTALYHTACKKDIVKRVSLYSLLTGMRYSYITKLKWKDNKTTSQGHFVRFRDVDRVFPIWLSEAGITKHITFHCFRHKLYLLWTLSLSGNLCPTMAYKTKILFIYWEAK